MTTPYDIAKQIIDDVKTRGSDAVIDYAKKFGDIVDEKSMVYDREQMRQSFLSLTRNEQELLERASARIRAFARAQRECITPVTMPIPGGVAGHTILPVARVGCYAPGGRYPLPSSILMTVIPARVAGVKEIIIASPKPKIITLAAAYVAGADYLIGIGGAQGIAALAFGFKNIAPSDMIVGPGNAYVTAAKQIVSGQIGIDMLAGPSELMIVADGHANPSWIAADLLAQAEHDPESKVSVISLCAELLRAVKKEITRQLETLSTREIAECALKHAEFKVVSSIDEAIIMANDAVPEHLQLSLQNADEIAQLFTEYGGLFIGERSAEVFGDYGFGPNHVLPTSKTARFSGGLSVLSFLRIRTFLRIDDDKGAIDATNDAITFARIEGLEGHARAAECRAIFS